MKPSDKDIDSAVVFVWSESIGYVTKFSMAVHVFLTLDAHQF